MLGCEQALRLTIDMGLRARTSTIIAVARPVIVFGAIVATFSFLGWTLVSNWNDLSSEEIDVQPALLVLSILPGIAAVVVMGLTWAGLIRYLEGRDTASAQSLLKIFLYSWVGRYVPGKVAYVAGRFLLGRSIRISSASLAGSMAYEGVLQLMAGAALASVTLVPTLAIESESFLPYLALPALAVGGAIVLHPRVLGWVLRFGLRVAGRESVEFKRLLPPRQIAKVTGMYVGAFLLNGVGFYLLIISLTDYSPRYLPLAVGLFGLAAVVGLVSVFAPAGIGVREGILVVVLQTTMPVELAILVSLVARVWATVIDLLLIAGCFFYDQLSGERLLINALRGRGSENDAPSALDP
ncbi:MAG: flippase-like domain-containing protein [Chloroflexi bacterium]|nr:flippase-like domain-containing protein [Chloroflexota bacterium]